MKTIQVYLVIVTTVILLSLAVRLFPFKDTITVARTYTAGRNNNFFVVSSEGRVYRYGNDIFRWDWDAAEEWSKLSPGKTFRVRGYGVRIQFLGMFPTITEFDTL